MMEASANRVSSLEARITTLEATAPVGGRQVWDDKYADNHRLRVDLEAAHAEIRRLGGVIPEPCGPIIFRSVCGAELEPVFAGEIVEVEYCGPEETSAPTGGATPHLVLNVDGVITGYSTSAEPLPPPLEP